MATATKTNVIGYFNPNDYPLTLSISAHNMMLRLDPKKYIVARSGALVNDPMLDAFVGKGKLSRASDPKQQVDIVLLSPVNPAPAPGVAPTTFTHAVTQVTGFTTKNGRVTPVQSPEAIAAAQTAVVPPPISYNPVRGMSVEEAKRLRLIRPTRPVPEDFGADETTGAPRSGRDIPQIKYATDATRAPKPRPLPPELAQPATPGQASLISNLERAAQSNPEAQNVLQSAPPPVAALPPSGPIPGLPKPNLTESEAPAPARPAPAQRTRVTAPPIPTNPEPTQMVAAEEPQEPEEESGLVVEEDLSGDTTVAIPPAPHTLEVPPILNEDETGLTCPRCPEHKPFKNLGLFKRHIRKFHPADEAVLLAPFQTPTPA